MSLRKILENLTFTSSTFDQKYVHTYLASPAPFPNSPNTAVGITVIFHGFFYRSVCVEVLSCSYGMFAIQIEELNEIKKVWKPSASDRPPRLNHFQIQQKRFHAVALTVFYR